jgi:hypothetical protein
MSSALDLLAAMKRANQNGAHFGITYDAFESEGDRGAESTIKVST